MLALSLALICGPQPLPAQSTALIGSFGFVAGLEQLDSNGSHGVAVLGLINFDGAGNVSGTATIKPRNIDNPQEVVWEHLRAT